MRERLLALGHGVPAHRTLVAVDFERGEVWLDRLKSQSFDATQPTFIAAAGVSMYLTKEAIAATLRQVAGLAPGSALVMSLMLPIVLTDPAVRFGVEAAARGARAAGTP